MTITKRRVRQMSLSGLSAAAVAAMLLTGLPGTAVADTAEPDMWTPTVNAAGEITATLSSSAANLNTFEVWIETAVDTDEDGKNDRLHAVMQVPKVAGPDATVPTVIAASPYYGGIYAAKQHNPYRELWDPSQPKTQTTIGDWDRPGDGDSPNYGANGNYWLTRGFAFMKLSAVGTEKSTGCPAMLDRNEAEATKAAIQWLTSSDGVKAYTTVDGDIEVSAKDWSAGKVGMTGTSYDGALPMITSTTGVKGLEVIAPMAPVYSFYDYYHFGGGMYGPQGYQGEDLDNYVLALYPRGQNPCVATAEKYAAQQDRDSGDLNDFWDERNMMNYIDNVTTPTLIGHGQADLNVRVSQSTDWYEALRARGVPTKLYLHQYSHINVGSASGGNWTSDLNKWFGHYLYNVDNGVENQTNTSRIQLENRTTWIDEPSWPAPGTEPVTLYPTAGGAGIGGLEPEVRTGSVETTTFQDDSTISLQRHINAASSGNRLVYQSEPLQSEVRLSGKATAKLQIALDRPAANITMVIADRNPATGTSKIIARSWTDPQNRTDVRTTEAVVPGTSYALNLTFVPTDYRIPAGHTIALMVASSDTETSLLPPTTTGLTVDTSATSITLPITGSTAALRAALGEPAQPAIEVAEASIEAPAEQTVTGSGLAPQTTFTLDTGVAGADAVEVTTDAAGTFSTTIPVFNEAPATRSLSLLAGRATIAQTSFVVTEAAPTASVKSLAGKGYISVSATNDYTVAADIVITTAYGSKTFTDVAPGKTVAVSINSRLSTVPAGTATVTLTRTVDGQPVTDTRTAAY